MLLTTATRSLSSSSSSSVSESWIWPRRLTGPSLGGACGGPEGAAVAAWRRRRHTPEMLAQRGGGAEADPPGDLVDRLVGFLEQPARLLHALGEQPLQR